MTRQEITDALKDGKTVFWRTKAYTVKAKGDDLVIVCIFNGFTVYADDSLRTEPESFHIAQD